MGRALIVDDDPSFRLGLAAVLRLEGFVTASAATCREALDELAKGSVDVLFVDVNLPDGSGFDLLPRPDAPTVIVVTAEPSLSIADEALSLGAWDCLAKPVERMRVRMTREPRPERGCARRSAACRTSLRVAGKAQADFYNRQAEAGATRFALRKPRRR
jgi:DNA-binding response OmpR family regulator